MTVIEAKGLRKVYSVTRKKSGLWGAVSSLIRPERDRVEAVKGIDLRIEKGEIVGFLGPNGAGKTTTIKMLSGIMYPTSGQASVLGYVPWRRERDMLARIALVMGNKQQLWWDLPAVESFRVLRVMYDVPETEYERRLAFLTEELDLADKLDVQVRKMSLGERMKCELIAALLHNPEVLFLDEPTIGLDLVSQKRIRDFLRDLNRRESCTIVLTSHYMQDVQELAQRVVVIDHGSLIYEGTISSLSARFATTKQLRLLFGGDATLPDMRRFGEVLAVEGRTVSLAVPKESTAQVAGEILRSLPVVDISVEDVSVEEIVRRLFESGR
ncbi:MAG TPA: ATP-binding cassette domain-containing protein [Fimbriimonadaceae bacterium]|nr:ATP-binding cassette domain-containing protein [Fimbriimonadaceae bacterium]